MSTPPANPPNRFIGLDVHKHSIVVAAVDKEQQILLRPRRVALPEFVDWAQTHLQSTDAVVLEATANAWQVYDQLAPLVASVTVAHPLLVKAESSGLGQDRRPRQYHPGSAPGCRAHSGGLGAPSSCA